MDMAQHGENPLARVREGMQVVDARGMSVGVVTQVQLGDPQAVTTQGQRSTTDDSLMASVAALFTGTEPDVPAELAARLVRLGYLKIDAVGLLERDRYVSADRVGAVAGNVVHLSVPERETVRRPALRRRTASAADPGAQENSSW